MSMTEQELTFTKKPREYQNKVFQAVEVLMTLDSSLIVEDFTINFIQSDDEFNKDVELVLTTLTKHGVTSAPSCSGCTDNQTNPSDNATSEDMELVLKTLDVTLDSIAAIALELQRVNKTTKVHNDALVYLLGNQ